MNLLRRVSPGLMFMLLWCAVGLARGQELHIPIYRAIYSVGRGSFSIGTTRFTLVRNANGTYTYQSVTVPSGLIALFRSDVIMETTRFKLSDGRLVPIDYSYSHTGDGGGSHTEKIQFMWDKGMARIQQGSHQKTLPVKPGTDDRLLAQLAMSLDLQAGRKVNEYRVLNHDTVSTYHLQVSGHMLLKTQAGSYQAIELERKDAKKKRTTTFWLAPKLNYLPVQMEQTEPGKSTISLVLTEIKFNTKTSAQ